MAAATSSEPLAGKGAADPLTARPAAEALGGRDAVACGLADPVGAVEPAGRGHAALAGTGNPTCAGQRR
jgi:hypothetical protein